MNAGNGGHKVAKPLFPVPFSNGLMDIFCELGSAVNHPNLKIHFIMKKTQMIS